MLSPGILKQKRKGEKKKDVQVSVMTKILKICIKLVKIVETIGNLSYLGTKKVNQNL